MPEEERMGKDNQEFLRKLDNIDQAGKRIVHWILVILYALFTCFILAATVYYAIGEFRGNADTRQLTICCATLLILAAIPVCSRLVDYFIKLLFQKNDVFEPAAMELPVPGTVSLEDALHKLSTKTGVIVWDSIWGCMLFSLLLLLLFGLGNPARILLLCVCMAAVIAVGHGAFYWLWKRRTFRNKMLRNTSGVIGLDNPQGFAAAVEESLKRGILSYEKELILTDEYILGNGEWDTYYTPVVIPRERITEFVFFYRRTVGGKTSRTVGILRCNENGRKLADLVLGPQLKAERIMKILRYYQVSWREEELTYV